MCLDINTLHKINPPIGTSEQPIVRYKILRKSTSISGGDLIKFSSRNYEHINSHGFSIKLNEWMTANPRIISNEWGDNDTYQAGFHIFKTLEDAEEALAHPNVSYLDRHLGDSIFKVEVKEIYIEGMQEGIPCQVARYMRVLEEIVVKDKEEHD